MSLIHWYPLVEDLADKITGEKLTGSFTIGSRGKIGNNLDTNTVHESSFVMNNSWNPITSSISMACWVKFDYAKIKEFFSTKTSSYDTPAGNIIGNHSYAGLGLIWSGNSLKNFTTMKVFAHIRGTGANTGTSSYTVPDNTWTHIALTADYETKTLKFYLNGEYKSSTSYSSLTDTGSGATRKLMLNYSGVYGGNGPGLNIPISLNDVRIYDHALSQAEVKELSKALVMHYTFDDILAEPTTNLVTSEQLTISSLGMSITYSRTGEIHKVVSAGTAGVANTVRLNIPKDVLTSGQSYYASYKYRTVSGTGNFLPSDWCDNITAGNLKTVEDCGDFYYVTCPCPSRVYDGTYRFLDLYIDGQSTIEMWDFQLQTNSFPTPYCKGSRSSQIYNETGLNQPISTTNFKLSTISNNGSYSGYFDGQTSCIDTPVIKPNMFTEDYTLSFWVYPLDSGRAVYFGDHQISSVPTINFERTADGAFRYYHNGSPDKSFIDTNTPEKTWTMLTVTYTPGTMKVYKNGVLAETLSHTATITKNINGIMRIGRDNRTGSDYGATPLYGYISDFRFYVTCLSAGDVQELYKTKAYVTDKGDIMCGEFIENKTEAEVTEKSIFECNETQEKLNIPGFELLDGILIEKNPYFNTGLVFSDVNTSIYVDAEVTPTNTSGNNCLAGCGDRNWNGPIMLNFCGGKMEFGTSGYNTSTEPQGQFAANERLTVQAEIYPTTQKWYKNNVQINNITQRERKTTNVTFAIGTFKTSSGTVGATHSFKGYIHRFYVKYGDEIRCYLPAKRKSDNVYGLYDIHTKTFLVNSGGGTVSGTTSTLCDEAAIYQDGRISGREIIEL